MTEEQKAEYIAALVRESAGYKRTGNIASLADVEAELSRVRGESKPPAQRAQTRVKTGSTR
jgi:hypothetical protein